MEEISKLSDKEFDPTILAIVDACNYNDFICKNNILNVQDNTFYEVCSSIKSVNVL
jgi:hypothetical protein